MYKRYTNKFLHNRKYFWWILSLTTVRVSPINYKLKFNLGLNFRCSSKWNMLNNSNYVTFFKRIVVTSTDFCLSRFPQHQHVQLESMAELSGSCFDFNFDFSHNLEIRTNSDFDFQHDPII